MHQKQANQNGLMTSAGARGMSARGARGIEVAMKNQAQPAADSVDKAIRNAYKKLEEARQVSMRD